MLYKGQRKISCLKSEIKRLKEMAESDCNCWKDVAEVANGQGETEVVTFANWMLKMSEEDCDGLDQLLYEVDRILDKQHTYHAEWVPYMHSYRIYDPKEPQKTLAYEDHLPDGVVEVDADSMHVEQI